MHATRVPFDPQAAFVVACDDFHICGQRFERGAPFPWRDVGIEEHDLGLLWLTLKVDVAPDTAEDAPKPTDTGTHLASMHVAPGEVVHVATPEQRKKTHQPRR